MLYRILLFSVIPQHESAIGIHISSPFRTSLPSPCTSNPSRLITEPLFELLEPQSKFPLAIYFTYGNVSFHVILHTSHPLVPPTTPCPYICSLCLCLHCCLENKSISTLFLDSIYMCQYMIFLFLFLTYFTLYNRL